jgi:hypothetical protein
LAGATKCDVVPAAMSPVLKAPDSEVRVCVTPSLFTTVTVSPGETRKVSGLKAKFSMVTVAGAPVAVDPEVAVEPEVAWVPGEDEQAARTTAEVSRARPRAAARSPKDPAFDRALAGMGDPDIGHIFGAGPPVDGRIFFGRSRFPTSRRPRAPNNQVG